MAAISEAVTLLKALRKEVAEVTEHGRALLARLRDGKLRTDRGVSLLGLRAAAMLHYVTDLALLLRSKSGGRSLREEPALPRLLESRVVLEKLRPLEQRMRYQLDKLLRAAAAGAPGANDPLSFRPDPSNLAQEEEEEEEEEEGSSAPKAGGGQSRYVPPRLVPVPYAPAEDEPQARHQRALQAARRRALSSALLRELRDELGDGPELLGGTAPHRELQRTQLEESMMVRLSESRQQRALRRLRAMGAVNLDSITHFGDTAALLGPQDQESLLPPPKKKKKVVKRKAGRRKGFRRRR
ncbi:neuroguidin isoform X2 [Gallus gallus]|uniref:Neuroguidin n=1 Tax=Gallus gallus TaxID=9031 RepID=A0A8V0XM85_CHICK|nr:neuroguidin isoform X2 [Gallus gallus]XP_040550771.1 neuroguidin isoform X2 [Gallus gallus]